VPDTQVQDFIRMNMGIDRMGLSGELNLQNMSLGRNGLGRFDINVVEDQLLQNGGKFAFTQEGQEQSLSRVYDQILDTIQTGQAQLDFMEPTLKNTFQQAGSRKIVIESDGVMIIPPGTTAEGLIQNGREGLKRFEEAILRQRQNPDFRQELLNFGSQSR
jgi:hypothetical protein